MKTRNPFKKLFAVVAAVVMTVAVSVPAFAAEVGESGTQKVTWSQNEKNTGAVVTGIKEGDEFTVSITPERVAFDSKLDFGVTDQSSSAGGWLVPDKVTVNGVEVAFESAGYVTIDHKIAADGSEAEDGMPLGTYVFHFTADKNTASTAYVKTIGNGYRGTNDEGKHGAVGDVVWNIGYAGGVVDPVPAEGNVVVYHMEVEENADGQWETTKSLAGYEADGTSPKGEVLTGVVGEDVVAANKTFEGYDYISYQGGTPQADDSVADAFEGSAASVNVTVKEDVQIVVFAYKKAEIKEDDKKEDDKKTDDKKEDDKKTDDKKEQPTTPQTGDSANVALYLVALGAAGVVVAKKRKTA